MPAPKLLEERLADARALVDRLEAEIENEVIKNDVREGDRIKFVFGRATTRRELVGLVRGIAIDRVQGMLLRVESGEGFHAESYKINIRDVLKKL
jgi:hypothetical protein